MKRGQIKKLFDGVEVPRLGIGQDWKGDFDINLGKKILVQAYKRGYNFWDTADNYNTHCHIKAALKEIPREKVVISTKISSQTKKQAKKDVGKCFEELGTDYIDIIFLHGVDSVSEFKKASGAWKYLEEVKKQGKLKARGVSTHTPSVVDFLANSDCDVILTTMNKKGHTVYGDFKKQIKAVKKAARNKKGLVAMKVLGVKDPELVEDVFSSIKFVAKLPFHTLLIGIRSMRDLNEDIEHIEKIKP
jgi:predicted aldo/keto reductase-like oxidoreductase